MNACFLDTSAVLDLLRHRLPAQAAVRPFQDLLLPFVVLGELVAGTYQASDTNAEMARLEAWLLPVQIFGADEETVFIYGELLGDLERQGRRIPTNDVRVAAVAVQFDLPLLARDEHFGRIPRLSWITYRIG